MTRALRFEYHDRIVEILDRVLSDQQAPLDAARDAVADTIRGQGLVHVTGSGHSHMLAEEVFYRAGGIAAAQAMFDEDLMLHKGAERSTRLEREPGRAAAVFADYGVSKGDVIIIASNSGRNAYPVEMALLAKQRGVATIAITSLKHSRQVKSRHESGLRLFEVVDIVLDNGGDYGDGALAVPGLHEKLGPTSTIVGAFLINTVVAEAAALLLADGVPVDVYQSANVEGEDADAAGLIQRWRGRVRGL